MTTGPEGARILAADIGATNCRFALFDTVPELSIVREQWFRGADFASFTTVLDALRAPGKNGAPPFLDTGAAPDIAVFAPAGPVVRDENGQYCRISNLPWRIDSREAASALGTARVRLINDFAAQAHACLIPGKVDAVDVPITAAAPVAVPGAPVAVTGAGTGFGTALVLNADAGIRGLTEGKITILPGEGGHAEFPFIGKDETGFARFAAKAAGTDRLIGDAVLNGDGLGRLFTYLTGRSAHPHEATAQATEHPEVMRWYARFYGRACRIYVLQTLARGGLFITGGMALRVPVLQHPAFAEEFCESAAHRHWLETMPVRHMRKPQTGLWGAALYGLAALGAVSQ